MSRVITDGGFFHAMNAERSDEMAVFRIERTRDYTVMSNHHLRDKALSLKSKGLLSMMLSLPEDWNYTTRGLAKICKEGVDAIGGALRELEAAGYIVRHQMRDRQGRISDTEYVIYEQPQPKEPDMYCADCGAKMYVHRTSNGKRIPQYTCSAYSKVPVGTLCNTQHRINESVVLELIGDMLKAIFEYAKYDRSEFIETMMQPTEHHRKRLHQGKHRSRYWMRNRGSALGFCRTTIIC